MARIYKSMTIEWACVALSLIGRPAHADAALQSYLDEALTWLRHRQPGSM